jgi:transketolase
VDYNRLQLDGTLAEIMEIEPLAEKWRAFGWQVLEIDGHNFVEILDALSTAQATRAKPTVIIARTVKGRGVSFMENQVKWHAGGISKEQYEQALVDLACGGASNG